jgi:Ca2+-binding RTX toxin-like protein
MHVRASRRTAGFVTFILTVVLVSFLIGGASAASPCVGSREVNALTTVSADGDTVYGSACNDRIVVTSPVVEEVVGGEGDDVIFANPNVEVVEAGPGDDVVYGDLPEPAVSTALVQGGARIARRPLFATISLTEKKCEAGVSCYGGDGSQELIGSSGNDKIFGQRGNDVLKGNSGNDELFGGVGDECPNECAEVGISGGAGNDLLSGGLGTDHLNGNQESDLLLGDGTIDTIEDTGPSGTDTLSFATAVTPGFHGAVGPSGFPADSNSEERGVNIHIDGTQCEGEFESCDNDARYGGGVDNLNNVSGFENIIGSPFADVIVGSNEANRIDGGGGTDAIYGKGGNDTLFGGPDGDYITGEEGTDTVNGEGGADNCIAETTEDCSGTAESVTQRDRTKISAGFMAASPPETLGWSQVFLTGSTGADRVKATYSLEGGTGYVTFTTEAESAAFDTSGGAASANCTYESAKVKCTLPKPLDAITLGGMGGDDKFTLEGFPETTTPVLLGGEGSDELTTGGTEDMLVDGNGSGNDTLRSGSYDDALINNEGTDSLQGGNGNDLLLSAANCEGDTLQGAASGEGDGAAVNSSSWAKLPEGLPGVVADLEKGKAGDTWSGSTPACSSGTAGTLANIDDFEGSSGNDQFYGDSNGNNILGRLGKDELYGRAGVDRLEAKDGINEIGGGGEGSDSCVLDAGDKFNSCP